MKFLFDFFPLLVFFGAWLAVDIFFATAGAMAATTIQVAWSWLKYRKVDRLLWINFGAIAFFGGLTLILQDKRFIMIKPTVVYWIIAGGLLIAHYGFRKNAIRLMMDQHFDAPDLLWKRWLMGWVLFFLSMGVLNLFIAYNFSEGVWATFKVFGVLALILILSAAQVFTLMPYAKSDSLK
jgi:intracellular septation protein